MIQKFPQLPVQMFVRKWLLQKTSSGVELALLIQHILGKPRNEQKLDSRPHSGDLFSQRAAVHSGQNYVRHQSIGLGG